MDKTDVDKVFPPKLLWSTVARNEKKAKSMKLNKLQNLWLLITRFVGRLLQSSVGMSAKIASFSVNRATA